MTNIIKVQFFKGGTPAGNIGQMCHAGRISERLPRRVFMSGQDYEQLSLFPGDSPVSRSVWPGSAEARMMTVTSGRKCLESSTSSGPLGLLEKMLLESSVWRSTRCFLTWKTKATKRGMAYACEIGWEAEGYDDRTEARHIPGRYTRSSPPWCPRRKKSSVNGQR